jgi:hypothetical protein
MQLQWPLQKANNLKNMSVYVYCHIKVTAPSLEGWMGPFALARKALAL